MTHNVSRTVPGHTQSNTHPELVRVFGFFVPSTPSSITTALHSIQDDKMKSGHTSILCRFEISS